MQEISTEVSVLGGVVFASDAAAFGGVAPKSKSAKGSFFGGYPPVADGGVALVLSWKWWWIEWKRWGGGFKMFQQKKHQEPNCGWIVFSFWNRHL